MLKPDTARMVAVVQRVVGGALSALGYSFFALILVALILLELPARKEAEAGTGGMRSRFDEVSVSVRHFVALTGLIGAGLAVVNLVAMLALGTDFPMVWAVLLFLLNFVPFGFAIGMLPPVAVTLLEHGVTRAAILLGVLVVSNLLSDNVVKPKLMGSGFGPVAAADRGLADVLGLRARPGGRHPGGAADHHDHHAGALLHRRGHAGRMKVPSWSSCQA